MTKGVKMQIMIIRFVYKSWIRVGHQITCLFSILVRTHNKKIITLDVLSMSHFLIISNHESTKIYNIVYKIIFIILRVTRDHYSQSCINLLFDLLVLSK